MNEYILGLGSNIEPEKNIPLAIQYLQKVYNIIRIASPIKTKAIGMNAQDFLNTALSLESALSPTELKDDLIQWEKKLGRDKKQDQWKPRTIDLDILVFNGKIIDEDVYKRSFLQDLIEQIEPERVWPWNKN